VPKGRGYRSRRHLRGWSGLCSGICKGFFGLGWPLEVWTETCAVAWPLTSLVLGRITRSRRALAHRSGRGSIWRCRLALWFEEGRPGSSLWSRLSSVVLEIPCGLL
jgi:hypothetical protein